MNLVVDQTWHGPEGARVFSTIQAAIEAAQENDCVKVERGWFTEQVVVPANLHIEFTGCGFDVNRDHS